MVIVEELVLFVFYVERLVIESLKYGDFYWEIKLKNNYRKCNFVEWLSCFGEYESVLEEFVVLKFYLGRGKVWKGRWKFLER